MPSKLKMQINDWLADMSLKVLESPYYNVWVLKLILRIQLTFFKDCIFPNQR